MQSPLPNHVRLAAIAAYNALTACEAVLPARMLPRVSYWRACAQDLMQGRDTVAARRRELDALSEALAPIRPW